MEVGRPEISKSGSRYQHKKVPKALIIKAFGMVPVAGVEPAPCCQDWILRSLRVWEDKGKQCFTRSVKAPESPDIKRIFARSPDSLIRYACYYGKIEKIPVFEHL